MKTLFTGAERKELREAAQSGDAASFAEGFFRRHGELARVFRKHRLRVLDGGGSLDSRNHGEARQVGTNEIMLFAKFWQQSLDIQDAVFAHEIGHAVLTQYGLQKMRNLAETLGVETWDTAKLPYAQHNMHEAFADVFAEYFLHRPELKRRYPDWLALVEVVLGKRRAPKPVAKVRHDEPEVAVDWKATAKRLMAKRTGKGLDDLHYRAYMREIIAGRDPSHLVKQFSGAREARQDLIDQGGM